MKIDKKIVQKTAHLARLYLNEQDVEEMQKSMSEITDWMDKLNQLDTSHIVPLIQMSEEENILREDVVSNMLPHDKGLFNAPAKDSNYFRVPKVLE